MENVDKCPICGSPEHALAVTAVDHTVSHDRFAIHACKQCGFHFTTPRPTQQEIGAYYLSKDYISHEAKAHGLRDRIYHLVRKRAIRGKHQLIARHQPSGTALDVGCGTGDFLAYLRDCGYAVQGVEVSDQARAVADSKGLQVAPNLEHLKAGTFDLITLWHVLEHVEDPRHTLQQLHDRCAHNGLLVIAVPDRESWDSQHYGPQWAAWDVPRHLSHFRRTDIKRLLGEVGFTFLESRKMWFDAPYVCMLSEQYRGAGQLSSMVKGALSGFQSNLVSMTSKRPTSSTLYLAKRA